MKILSYLQYTPPNSNMNNTNFINSHPNTTDISRSLSDEMKEVINKIDYQNQNNNLAIPYCIRVIFDLARLKAYNKEL